MRCLIDPRPARVMRLAVAAAGCVAVVAATTAQAESPLHYTYVGSSGPSTFVDPVIEGQNNPAGRPAVSGHMSFKPLRPTFTLRFDDVAVSAGRSLPLYIVQGAKERFLCVRDGVTVTVAGFRPGREVTVFVTSATDALSPFPSRCDELATAGSAFVGL